MPSAYDLIMIYDFGFSRDLKRSNSSIVDVCIDDFRVIPPFRVSC